jgi:hypothetical protein
MVDSKLFQDVNNIVKLVLSGNKKLIGLTEMFVFTGTGHKELNDFCFQGRINFHK